MRYTVIIGIIVLAVLIFLVRRRYIVAKGAIYCDMCKDTINIYKTTCAIDEDEKLRSQTQVIGTKLIAIEYNSSDRGTFFYQMENVLYELDKRYKALENYEDYFQEDDWKNLQHYHKSINDLANRILNLEWREGYQIK